MPSTATAEVAAQRVSPLRSPGPGLVVATRDKKKKQKNNCVLEPVPKAQAVRSRLTRERKSRSVPGTGHAAFPVQSRRFGTFFSSRGLVPAKGILRWTALKGCSPQTGVDGASHLPPAGASCHLVQHVAQRHCASFRPPRDSRGVVALMKPVIAKRLPQKGGQSKEQTGEVTQ